MVNEMYPVGALEWIRAVRPDVAQLLKEYEADVNAAVLGGDQAWFVKALQVWSDAHRRAFLLYSTRPPVIERDRAVPAEAA